MDSELVDKVKALVEDNQQIEVDGHTYAKAGYKLVQYFKPRPSHLQGMTLTGLVDYLHANREQIDLTQLMLLVHDFSSVSLVERFTAEEAGRTVYYKVNLDSNLPTFRFGEYMPVEDFIIKARALMAPSDDLDAIITIVSKVVAQDEITAGDNGLAQNVQIKKGLSGAVATGVSTRGTYALSPYRTFRELEQPMSRFILRLKAVEGELPHVALFDAEGQIWRHWAMQEIKNWLVAQIGDAIPVLA